MRWEQPIKSVAGSAPGAFFMALLPALLLAPLCACSQASEHNCPAFGDARTVTIDKVIDGDTIRLADGGKVRLIGINTPELGRDGEPDQPWAKQARQALQTFLGQRALLLADLDSSDNHGRTLAHIYNLQGESAEAHLLKQGLGWHVAIPPNLTQADCLAKAERLARDRRIGLWSSGGIASTLADNVSEGGFQVITGQVSSISFGKRGWWINLGDNIAAVIYPEHQHRFDRRQLAALTGKTVAIRGWVYPSRSKKYQPWRIKLETRFGIEPATE